MNMHRIKAVVIAAVVTGSLMSTASISHADETLNAILKVGEEKNATAAKSQVKIDKLAEQTRELLTDYKTVMKQVDGLIVYNTRLRKQIENQLRRISDIENSISQVVVIQRQMTPLVIRMIDGLGAIR